MLESTQGRYKSFQRWARVTHNIKPDDLMSVPPETYKDLWAEFITWLDGQPKPEVKTRKPKGDVSYSLFKSDKHFGDSFRK